MEITTTYSARIAFETEGADASTDDVYNHAMKIIRSDSLEVEVEGFDGCPACGPYIELRSEERNTLMAVANEVKTYIELYARIVEE